jgi:hypothetical protein
MLQEKKKLQDERSGHHTCKFSSMSDLVEEASERRADALEEEEEEEEL